MQCGPKSRPPSSTVIGPLDLWPLRDSVQQFTPAGPYIKRPSALNRMEIHLRDNISASDSCNYTDKCTILSGQVKKNPQNVDKRQHLLHYCCRRSFVTSWDEMVWCSWNQQLRKKWVESNTLPGGTLFGFTSESECKPLFMGKMFEYFVQ